MQASNKRPEQTAASQPGIPSIVGNGEFWVCGSFDIS